jgi:hypothetical protein
MNKYPLLIITLLSLVILASGCVSNNNLNQTKTYSQNGIYFVYNGTWEIANTSSTNAVTGVGDPNTVNSQTHEPNTFVIIQKPNVTMNTDLQMAYTQNYATFFNNTSNMPISEANITLNNNTALENTYITTSNGAQSEMMAVWVSQNGQIYVILCGAPPNNFENQQKNFNIIINSFKLQ